MPFRIGVLDIAAAVVLVAVILLPARAVQIGHAYEATDEQLHDIALEQARLAANPGDGDAAARLAELLTSTGQTDWAVRVAGEATSHAEAGSAGAWRALLAISLAHAERIEVRPAYEYAAKAMAACEQLGIGPDRCPGPEHARLSVYFEQLEAGVESGYDPRLDPQHFQEAVLRAVRMVRVRGTPPESDDRPDKDQPDKDQPDKDQPDKDGASGKNGEDSQDSQDSTSGSGSSKAP